MNSVAAAAASAAAAAAAVVATQLAKDRADERVLEARDRAAILIAIAEIATGLKAQETLCTERWSIERGKLNTLIAITMTGVLATLGYALIFWVEHR